MAYRRLSDSDRDDNSDHWNISDHWNNTVEDLGRAFKNDSTFLFIAMGVTVAVVVMLGLIAGLAHDETSSSDQPHQANPSAPAPTPYFNQSPPAYPSAPYPTPNFDQPCPVYPSAPYPTPSFDQPYPPMDRGWYPPPPGMPSASPPPPYSALPRPGESVIIMTASAPPMGQCV